MKPGEVLAEKYRLETRLGVGGMGEVWSATHLGTGREFAIKLMHPQAAASSSARRRFNREARASAKINHPCIVDVYDVCETDDNSLFLVMELLDGLSLADAFYSLPPLTIADFLAIMLDVTNALAAAHAVGIIHRDIKPANIFLHRDRPTGRLAPKVLDFGISKFAENGESQSTRSGAVLGSPHYMSPEQARSASSVDARTDIWAIGVILFEGLTGVWPHQGDNFSNLVVAICTTPPASIDLVAPGLPESLRAVIRDCLQPIDERIATAEDLAARLEAALGDPALPDGLLPDPDHPTEDGTGSIGSLQSFTKSSARNLSRSESPMSGTPPPTVHAVDGAPASNPFTPGNSRPAFQPGARTVPVQDRELQTRLEALRRGSSGFAVLNTSPRPLDPMGGTEACMNMEAPRGFELSTGARRPVVMPIADPATRGSGDKLRILAAVLAVTLAGIIVALVSVVRSAQSASATANSVEAPPPPVAPPPAEQAAAVPAPPAHSQPAQTASVARPSQNAASRPPQPAAATSDVPAGKPSAAGSPRPSPSQPKTGGRSRGTSKIEALGSGL